MLYIIDINLLKEAYMSDLMKKIGMNSQTLRVVMKSPTDKITKDGIVDFHITDGSTSSHFMELLSSDNPTQYMTLNLTVYDMESIALETDPMSWGSDNDRMTGINFTDIPKHSTPGPLTNNDKYGGYRNTSINMYHVLSHPTTRLKPFTPYPVQTSLRPQQSTFTEDDQNKTNFGNLFK